MKASRTGLWVAALLAAALGACGRPAPVETPPPAPPPAPEVADAERLAAALGGAGGESLESFLRDDATVAVRTECTSCPPALRFRDESYTGREEMRGLAATMAREPAGRPGVVRLVHGKPTCFGACCAYETGLLDHATVYLTRACFARDREGLVLVSLELVDGS